MATTSATNVVSANVSNPEELVVVVVVGAVVRGQRESGGESGRVEGTVVVGTVVRGRRDSGGDSVTVGQWWGR